MKTNSHLNFLFRGIFLGMIALTLFGLVIFIAIKNGSFITPFTIGVTFTITITFFAILVYKRSILNFCINASQNLNLESDEQIGILEIMISKYIKDEKERTALISSGLQMIKRALWARIVYLNMRLLAFLVLIISGLFGSVLLFSEQKRSNDTQELMLEESKRSGQMQEEFNEFKKEMLQTHRKQVDQIIQILIYQNNQNQIVKYNNLKRQARIDSLINKLIPPIYTFQKIAIDSVGVQQQKLRSQIDSIINLTANRSELSERQNKKLDRIVDEISTLSRVQEVRLRNELGATFANISNLVFGSQEREAKKMSNKRIKEIIANSKGYLLVDIENSGKDIGKKSHERGFLLNCLVTAELSINTYDKIFLKGDFRNATMANKVDWSNGYLKAINLDRAYFTQINLKSANLLSASLKHATFNRSDLSQALLANAKLDAAKFNSTKLIGANLNGADLTKAVMISADLQHANLSLANLNGTNLEKADLRHAIFEEARFNNVNLNHAKVTHDWFKYLEKQKVKGLKEVKDQYKISEKEQDDVVTYYLVPKF